MSTVTGTRHVVLLRGASYVGGELIRWLGGHPSVDLVSVTSRTFAGEPVWRAHPALRGQTDLRFTDEAEGELDGVDAVLIAGGHGESLDLVGRLLDAGYEGAVVDLSADFRFDRPEEYEALHGRSHPRPDLLRRFRYGLPEASTPYAGRWIANPGCFATGMALALYPLTRRWPALRVAVTALTGASGSGAKPKPTTHFPTRDGNVRAYKVFRHQHLPEIRQVVGRDADIAFVPASGPWTRGIWGTAHVTLERGMDPAEMARAFEEAYDAAPFVRLSPGELPELRAVVGTPFCDIGWVADGDRFVVGFSLDNLLKGAAGQAIQNLNLVLGLPETAGLLPASAHLHSLTHEP